MAKPELSWDSIEKSFATTPEPEKPEDLVPGKPPLRSSVVDTDPLDGVKYTTYLIKGEKKEFYSIGALAGLMHRQPVTLRSWEAKGWIPAPNFRTPAPKGSQIPGKATKGRRLYSRNQVLYLLSASNQFNLLEPKRADWKGFHQYMTNYPQD